MQVWGLPGGRIRDNLPHRSKGLQQETWRTRSQQPEIGGKWSPGQIRSIHLPQDPGHLRILLQRPVWPIEIFHIFDTAGESLKTCR
jgi:hypothetical protein